MDLGILNALNRISEKLGNLNVFSDQKDYNTRVFKSSAQSIPSNTWTKITSFTKQYDPENLFSTSSSSWTCPQSGFYHLSYCAYFDSLLGTVIAGIYKNGVLFVMGDKTYLENLTGGNSVNSVVYLEKGDYLELYIYQTSSVATNIASGSFGERNYFSVAKINSYIPPTPTQTQVKARATRITSNQILSNSSWSKIQFNSKIFDPLNCLDLTTNYRFTAPESGYYYIEAGVRFAQHATGVRSLKIEKNGSTASPFTQILVPTTNASFTPTIRVTSLEYLNKGDYIECYAFQDSGGNLDILYNLTTNFSIHKLSD